MLKIKVIILFLILFHYAYSQINTWTGVVSNDWYTTRSLLIGALKRTADLKV